MKDGFTVLVSIGLLFLLLAYGLIIGAAVGG